MKYLQLPAFALVAAFIIGCSNDDDESFTWQKDIAYKANLTQFLPDTGNWLWADSSFLSIIWDKVMSGELVATDPNTNEPMDSATIQSRLSRVDSLFAVSPVTMMDTVLVIHTIWDHTDINSVAFKERISYNSETNELNKEVIAIGPVREVINFHGMSVGQAVVFWVNVNQEEEG